MSLFEHAQPNPAGHADVTCDQLWPLPAGVRVIDVREAPELHGELGHVAGTEHIPMGVVPVHAMSWDRNAEVVLICRSSGRSGQVAQALHRMGFTRVMNMLGGMIAWNQAGLPVTK